MSTKVQVQGLPVNNTGKILLSWNLESSSVTDNKDVSQIETISGNDKFYEES